MSELSSEFLRAIEEACDRLPADCVMLSGGVDSSLLLACYRRPAITVALKGADAPDAHFSQLVAEHLGVQWLYIEVNRDTALRSLCRLITLINTFDRGLFNDLPAFFALSAALQRGWRRVASGQGAELLFAGYDFLMQAGPMFREYRSSVLSRTKLFETKLGKRLGVTMLYPYLAPRVVAIAKRTDLEDCILERAGGGLISKVPLRTAAMRYLPSSIAWRDRADLESGSGFAALATATIAFSETFDPVANPCRFYWDDAHRAMHRIFSGMGLQIPATQINMYRCEWCGGGVDQGGRHCPTCGAFPANQAQSL